MKHKTEIYQELRELGEAAGKHGQGGARER